MSHPSLQDSPDVIETERLRLIPLPSVFLEACLAGDRTTVDTMLGTAVTDDLFEDRYLLEMRLEQLRQDPDLEPWLVRAIVLRSSGTMIGRINFHTKPGPEYLDEFAPGGVELGYTIDLPYRRQGYASEAADALMQWAFRIHGVTRFVASIRPDNLPSQRMAERFGFKKVGSHLDEIDGPEDVLVREITEPSSL